MSIILFQRGDKTALTKILRGRNFSVPAVRSPDGRFGVGRKLQIIRDKLGKAIKITSGYRCLKHNAASRRWFEQQATAMVWRQTGAWKTAA